MTEPLGQTVHLVLGAAPAAGGDALGRLDDGRVVFVSGALPGEEVDAVVVDARRDFARAEVAAVTVASPLRRPPSCPQVARGCGGCPWQHVQPSSVPELKGAIVADALRRIGHLEVGGPDGVAMPAPLTVPAQGYRTTVRMAVEPDGRPAYHRRRSGKTVTVRSCEVAHPLLEDLIRSVRVPGADEVVLRVGVAGGERLVVPRGRRFRAATVRLPADARLVGPEEPGPGGGPVAGTHEQVDGRRWRISARSFWQSGPAAAELLVGAVDGAVGDALDRDGTLVDAYAGVGLLGGVVAARRRAHLTAIESDAGAAADAVVNLVDPALAGVEVRSTDVGDWRAPDRPVDVVVADPARPGLGRPGVAALVAARPRRLVLVSCDPASLGRDAGLLAAAGYRATVCQVLDLFPGTPHMEAVTVFAGPGRS